MDLEGVCGVRDFEEWEKPGAYYHGRARELATMEVNAAIEGFFSAGADSILVMEVHGPGVIDILKLDPRVELMRGPGTGIQSCRVRATTRRGVGDRLIGVCALACVPPAFP